jgi:hypothetical protein
MKIRCNTVWLEKSGSAKDEYEDAFAPSKPIDDDFEQFRCAIADGATESSFARQWAQLLVDGYLDRTEISMTQEAFRTDLEGKELEWFAQEKADKGAFAAFIGLELHADQTWTAEAMGDCCLIQFRANELIKAFPLAFAHEFNNTPLLLSSNDPESNDTLISAEGDWQSDDVFVLASDALACWIITNQKDKGLLLELLKIGDDNQAFNELVETLRARDSDQRLKNDDVTMLHLLVRA